MSGLPPVTVANIIRRFAPSFLATRSATPAQARVLRDVAACRTAALGGHVLECGQCGDRRIAYNSCRNRHCPSCLNHKSRDWLEARAAELLPVPYFHVVFTVPEEIASLALGNKKVVYNILFAATAETLLTIGRDPKHLGAELGFLAVLHTWDQKLRHHPHVHCVVPGGGLSSDGTRWVPSRAGFFLPVRVLSRLFRGKFLAKLRAAFDAGALSFAGSTAPLSTPAVFNAFVRRCRSKEWVVYAKAPFGSPEQVLKYLARYTHRVAISNARIEAVRGDQVAFRYRINSATNSHGSMQLLGVEFLRRFVQHVLPKGFTRIRSFGFLANCHKREKQRAIRDLLDANAPKKSDPPDTANESENAETCPSCGSHLVARVREIDPVPSLYWMPVPFAYVLKRPRKGSP